MTQGNNTNCAPLDSDDGPKTPRPSIYPSQIEEWDKAYSLSKAVIRKSRALLKKYSSGIDIAHKFSAEIIYADPSLVGKLNDIELKMHSILKAYQHHIDLMAAADDQECEGRIEDAKFEISFLESQFAYLETELTKIRRELDTQRKHIKHLRDKAQKVVAAIYESIHCSHSPQDNINA